MIESITEDNKSFKIICMKDLEYVIKILAIWTTLNELVGAKTRRDFIDSSGTKERKQFTYQHPFGIHLRCINQVDNHNNWRHATIYLERTWATKF